MSDVDRVLGLVDEFRRYQRLKDRVAALRVADGEALDKAAYYVLFIVVDGPYRASDIAARMGADPSTVSRHVASLVKAGLVRREASPEDGRVSILIATDEGRAMAEQIRIHRAERLSEILHDWSDDDLSALTALLGRFIDDVVTDIRAHHAGFNADDTNTKEVSTHER